MKRSSVVGVGKTCGLVRCGDDAGLGDGVAALVVVVVAGTGLGNGVVVVANWLGTVDGLGVAGTLLGIVPVILKPPVPVPVTVPFQLKAPPVVTCEG